ARRGMSPISATVGFMLQRQWWIVGLVALAGAIRGGIITISPVGIFVVLIAVSWLVNLYILNPSFAGNEGPASAQRTLTELARSLAGIGVVMLVVWLITPSSWLEGANF